MRYYQFLFTILLCLCSALNASGQNAPQCPLGDGWVYKTDFSDEFNGASLDGNKWWDFNPSWHGRKPAYFSRDNVSVKDGCLHLTAREQKPDEVSVENSVRGYDKYTKAIVKGKKRIKYGYFEARCKIMNSSASSAFWLYDPLDPPTKYREGAFSEEIDIFEIFGKSEKADVAGIYFMTVHRYLTPYVESIANAKQWSMPNKSAKLRLPFDPTVDFHTYGLLWTPTRITWYLDGKPVYTRHNDYFSTALYITFDTEIFEQWAGLPDSKDLPASFEVDYVRVWQQPDGEFLKLN